MGIDPRVLQKRELTQSPKRLCHPERVDAVARRKEELPANNLGLRPPTHSGQHGKASKIRLRRLHVYGINSMARERTKSDFGLEFDAARGFLASCDGGDDNHTCQEETHGPYYTPANLSGP